MLNTPMLEKGNTKDWRTVCTSCYNILLKNDLEFLKNLKNYPSKEVIEKYNHILQLKENQLVDKKIEIEKRKLDVEKQNNLLKERTKEIYNTIKLLNPTAASKREVAELPAILIQDEIIERISTGFLKEAAGSSGHGLIVATNFRIIFIDKPTIGFGIKMEDFPYDKITSVAVETGFLKGELKIICSGNTAIINLVTGAKLFSEFIRQKTLLKPREEEHTNSIGNDIISQIEKLASLKEKGILSEEEFTTQKAKLLDKL